MNAIALIKQHIPSITDRIEDADTGIGWEIDPGAMDANGDYIGMVRECRCGVIIEGYYEYNDHLIEEFKKAGYE